MPEFVNKGSAISGGNDMTEAKPRIEHRDEYEAHSAPRPGQVYFMSTYGCEAEEFMKVYSNNGMLGEFPAGAAFYTRRRPDDIITKDGRQMKNTQLRWLTTNQQPGAIPADMAKLAKAIMDDLKENDKGGKLVVFDASEYVITQTSYKSFLNLMQLMHDNVCGSKSALVISADPTALGVQGTHLLKSSAPLQDF